MPKHLPLIAGVIVGFLVGQQTQSWRMSSQLESERASHASYVANQQAASTEAIAGLLVRERELHEQIEGLKVNEQRIKQDMERKLADSDSVARRMRERLDDISGRVGTDTATSAECKAARNANGMLAELLGELDQLAGAFAESADRSRIAGEACQAVYGAVRKVSVRDQPNPQLNE